MSDQPTPEATVLVVDDDPDLARYVQISLELEGFRVEVEHCGREAIERAASLRPDLILLDVMMPTIDGFEVCKQLRANPRTAHCAIVMVTGRTMPVDTVVGLAAGADDYIAKPFDQSELIARLRAVLRRSQQLRDVSPLTGLPGNGEIRRTIEARLAIGEPFALVHADIDGFKGFNDRYGFVRGDAAINATAGVLLDAVDAASVESAFVGHIGGDDFAVLLARADVDRVCRDILDRFDAMAPGLYDADDVAAGGISVVDRQGKHTARSLMTLSLGVATSGPRTFSTASEMVCVAAEMKSAAKGATGSAYRVDRRAA